MLALKEAAGPVSELNRAVYEVNPAEGQGWTLSVLNPALPLDDRFMDQKLHILKRSILKRLPDPLQAESGAASGRPVRGPITYKYILGHQRTADSNTPLGARCGWVSLRSVLSRKP